MPILSVSNPLAALKPLLSCMLPSAISIARHASLCSFSATASDRPARAGSLLSLAAVLALAGCATTELTAVSDYDREFDFSRAGRIAILPLDRTVPTDYLLSDMQVRRIDEALGAELAARGYSVVESRDEADLWLSWHLVTRERTDIRAYNATSAYSCWRCGPPVADVNVRQYTEGTFIVDFIDPMRGRSVFRSTIQSRLKEQPDPEKGAERRARAATAVLKPFPPQPE